ncbi:hypothetical protein ACFT4A_25735 [Streptomyces sp. NPDC057099]|uniref:hypothetical protein n=1 Tax=Streptomyces sp. NPDC057099 TaxID=3346019 RepID=UPI00362FBEA8
MTITESESLMPDAVDAEFPRLGRQLVRTAKSPLARAAVRALVPPSDPAARGQRHHRRRNPAVKFRRVLTLHGR